MRHTVQCPARCENGRLPIIGTTPDEYARGWRMTCHLCNGTGYVYEDDSSRGDRGPRQGDSAFAAIFSLSVFGGVTYLGVRDQLDLVWTLGVAFVVAFLCKKFLNSAPLARSVLKWLVLGGIALWLYGSFASRK